MKSLDPHSETVIQLMLDAYDAIAEAHSAHRVAAFRHVCRRVIAAAADTGRLSHAECESWLSAIGMHARIPDADRIVQGEIAKPQLNAAVLH